MRGTELVGVIVALGAVTIAIVQLLIDLFPIRSESYQWWLENWFADRSKVVKKSTDVVVNPEDATRSLVACATGGQSHALFGLPVDQLVGQMSAAAQIALEYPKLHFSLLAILSQPGVPTIKKNAQQSPPAASAPAAAGAAATAQAGGMADTNVEDLKILRDFVDEPTLDSKPTAADARQRYLDARNRIAHRIQRNLDSIQIALSRETQIVVQIAALAVGLVVSFIFWLNAAFDYSFFTMVLIGIAAGYAAPIFGDVVLAIRRLGHR